MLDFAHLGFLVNGDASKAIKDEEEAVEMAELNPRTQRNQDDDEEEVALPIVHIGAVEIMSSP